MYSLLTTLSAKCFYPFGVRGGVQEQEGRHLEMPHGLFLKGLVCDLYALAPMWQGMGAADYVLAYCLFGFA